MAVNKEMARGKPAEYDHEIVKRRFRLTVERVSLDKKKILDFGCGNGAQTVLFANLNCNIDALDIDSHELAVFDEYIRNNQITNITTHLYDGGQIPFPSNHFDIVLSYEVLEHVKNQSSTLKEIYRILKDDGELIITVPNKGWVFETHGAYLPLLPWNRVPFFSWLPFSIHDRYAKARIYRMRDIVRLLSNNGFIIESTSYITAPMDVVINKRLKNLLQQTIFKSDRTKISIISTAILVQCEKGGGGLK